MTPKRHLIAAAWNKSEITARFLESFQTRSYQPWSLILVDNHSTDGTAELLTRAAKEYPLLRVITNDANLGCAKAWNQGIRLALSEGSELIGVLNNDLVFADAWDTGLLGFLTEHGDAHPIVSPHTMKCDLRIFERRASRFMSRNAHRTREKLGSEAMFFKPRVFQDVGLFDERYFVSYEDTDYYVRCRQSGYVPVITGASVLWHREKTTRGEIGSAHELEARAVFSAKWGGLDVIKKYGWEKSRWVIRYWRHRERLGLL